METLHDPNFSSIGAIRGFNVFHGRASKTHARIVYAWHQMADVWNEESSPVDRPGSSAERPILYALRPEVGKPDIGARSLQGPRWHEETTPRALSSSPHVKYLGEDK